MQEGFRLFSVQIDLDPLAPGEIRQHIDQGIDQVSLFFFIKLTALFEDAAGQVQEASVIPDADSEDIIPGKGGGGTINQRSVIKKSYPKGTK